MTWKVASQKICSTSLDYEDRPPKRDWPQAVRGPYKEAIAILRERHAKSLQETVDLSKIS
jgi:hypothetical protein